MDALAEAVTKLESSSQQVYSKFVSPTYTTNRRRLRLNLLTSDARMPRKCVSISPFNSSPIIIGYYTHILAWRPGTAARPSSQRPPFCSQCRTVSCQQKFFPKSSSAYALQESRRGITHSKTCGELSTNRSRQSTSSVGIGVRLRQGRRTCGPTSQR